MSVIFRHKYIKNAQNSGFLIIFFLKFFFSKSKKMLLPRHDTDLIPKFQVLIPKTATCTLCTRPHTAQTNSGLLVQRRDNSSSSRHSLSYNYTRIKIHHTWESTSWGHQGREKRENLLPNRFAIAYAIAARFNNCIGNS